MCLCFNHPKTKLLYLGVQLNSNIGETEILKARFSGSVESGYKIRMSGASLAAQWLRICLPMQGTRVRALVWEDPTCRGATRPVSHNY